MVHCLVPTPHLEGNAVVPVTQATQAHLLAPVHLGSGHYQAAAHQVRGSSQFLIAPPQ